MKSGSVTFDKTSQVDSIERSSDKVEKKSDKDMEYIFDDFLSKKISREEQAEMLRKEKLHESAESRVKQALFNEYEKISGSDRQEEKVYKDKTDSDSDSDGRLSVAGMTNSFNQNVESDLHNSEQVVSKLEGLISKMTENGLSESNMIVRISGGGEVSIDVALTRSRGQTEVYISSQSKHALEMVSNQVGALERHIQQQGHRNMLVTIVY